MAVDEETEGQPSAAELAEAKDPRFQAAKAAGAGDPGREMIEHVYQGAELTAEEETTALDYLLGAPAPGLYEVVVQVDSPAGRSPLTFVIKAQDGKRIERLENANRNDTTGQLDQIPASCAIVAEACEMLIDSRGREVDPRGHEWLSMKVRDALGKLDDITFADPGLAFARRFIGQQGLLVYVANEVRRVSGYDPERVAQSKRKLVKAALD